MHIPYSVSQTVLSSPASQAIINIHFSIIAYLKAKPDLIGFDDIKALSKFTSVIQATNVCIGRMEEFQSSSKVAIKYFRKSENSAEIWQAAFNNTEL